MLRLVRPVVIVVVKLSIRADTGLFPDYGLKALSYAPKFVLIVDLFSYAINQFLTNLHNLLLAKELTYVFVNLDT